MQEHGANLDTKQTCLHIESKAIQTHLGFLQDIISRLSDKSSTCKNWCITLTSAFILLSLRLENGSKYMFLSCIPIVVFFLLDSYYLYLERCFKKIYDSFVRKLHKGELKKDDIYLISRQSQGCLSCTEMGRAMLSPSVIIFYLPLCMIVFVVMIFYCLGGK
ncbi:hypothetical protein B9T19_06425 [Ignatzschineria sp. F8392]|uniref:hypothetical protein n=1 Tax=Ignatzschineria sp. F8392 TaxID=1980117 RepID=UPI000B97E658|nr:hypothetical protein [Ignatzschineria sp. F8392]OYQ79404.1 hypothetical protein B9T19_06425 [Ignatzschineria sp. F8392]